MKWVNTTGKKLVAILGIGAQTVHGSLKEKEMKTILRDTLITDQQPENYVMNALEKNALKNVNTKKFQLGGRNLMGLPECTYQGGVWYIEQLGS